MNDSGSAELITFTMQDDSSKLPMDTICNGFSIKDALLDVLDKHNDGYRMKLPPDELNNLVTELTETLAIKCGLKQGPINE